MEKNIRKKELSAFKTVYVLNGLTSWITGSYFLAHGLYYTFGTLYETVMGTDATGLGIILGAPMLVMSFLQLTALRFSYLFLQSKSTGRIPLIILLIFSSAAFIIFKELLFFPFSEGKLSLLFLIFITIILILNFFSIFYFLSLSKKLPKSENLILDSKERKLFVGLIAIPTSIFLILILCFYTTLAKQTEKEKKKGDRISPITHNLSPSRTTS